MKINVRNKRCTALSTSIARHATLYLALFLCLGGMPQGAFGSPKAGTEVQINAEETTQTVVVKSESTGEPIAGAVVRCDVATAPVVTDINGQCRLRR